VDELHSNNENTAANAREGVAAAEELRRQSEILRNVVTDLAALVGGR
jgi:hypothetical protein